MTINDKGGRLLLEVPGNTLVGASLNGARLDRASLREARLDGASLRGASLCGADLHGASLDEASLRGASLYGASLDGAWLRGADLRGADLRGADLRGASLVWARLDGASLRWGSLDGADLHGARLNWRSGWLLGHLLLHAAKSHEQRRLAALVMVASQLGWCWDEYLVLADTEPVEWALGVLAGYVVEGDKAPACVREYQEVTSHD